MGYFLAVIRPVFDHGSERSMPASRRRVMDSRPQGLGMHSPGDRSRMLCNAYTVHRQYARPRITHVKRLSCRRVNGKVGRSVQSLDLPFGNLGDKMFKVWYILETVGRQNYNVSNKYRHIIT